MYLTLENLNDLNDIISKLNNIEDEDEKKQFLNTHTEDSALFLNVLKKVNKKKISMGYNKAKVQKQREEVETNLYEEDEIYAILNRKENIEIIKEYSFMDLKKMYAAVYKTNPTSNYTKERIIGVLRNRMHTMKRAESFGLSVEERNKRTVNSL